ncbi:MAG: hypothetical protein PHT77_01490 [Bacteroidales bacterium]|nr:hypothetical protein [Bacteroidales bacterium]
MKESTIDVALNKITGFNFYNRSLYNFDKRCRSEGSRHKFEVIKGLDLLHS